MVQKNAKPQETGAKPARAVAWIFACTMFLSAFLRFQVQLIISKYVLPWFGGSAAVWTTSLLVFQTLLLAGYVYLHLIAEHLSHGAQVRLHITVLTVALVSALLSFHWPSAVTPSAVWKPASTEHPVRNVIVITIVAAGLPFFVLSTTGPLLQRWFSGQGGGAETYRLYSVSNLGSLLGLLSFPFAIEPMLRLKVQGVVWTLLFGLFCLGCGWCAWQFLHAGTIGEDARRLSREAKEQPPSIISVLLWFLLAACASAMLLATTNQLCQEVFRCRFCGWCRLHCIC